MTALQADAIAEDGASRAPGTAQRSTFRHAAGTSIQPKNITHVQHIGIDMAPNCRCVQQLPGWQQILSETDGCDHRRHLQLDRFVRLI
jgi:hypothetical protein